MGIKQNYCGYGDDLVEPYPAPTFQPGDFVRHRGHGAVFRIVDSALITDGASSLLTYEVKSQKLVRSSYAAGHLELLDHDSAVVQKWLREEHEERYAERMRDLARSIPEDELGVSF